MRFPDGMLHPPTLENPLDLSSLMDQGRGEGGKAWTFRGNPNENVGENTSWIHHSQRRATWLTKLEPLHCLADFSSPVHSGTVTYNSFTASAHSCCLRGPSWQVMPWCTSHTTSCPRSLVILSLCILQWSVPQFEKTRPPEENPIHTNLNFQQRTLKPVGMSFTSLSITTIPKIRHFLKNKVEKKFHTVVDESYQLSYQLIES